MPTNLLKLNASLYAEQLCSPFTRPFSTPKHIYLNTNLPESRPTPTAQYLFLHEKMTHCNQPPRFEGLSVIKVRNVRSQQAVLEKLGNLAYATGFVGLGSLSFYNRQFCRSIFCDHSRRMTGLVSYMAAGFIAASGFEKTVNIKFFWRSRHRRMPEGLSSFMYMREYFPFVQMTFVQNF